MDLKANKAKTAYLILADGTVFGFSFTSMDYNDDLEILLPNGLTKGCGQRRTL